MLHNSKNILIQLSLIISSIAFSPIEILAIVKGPDGTYYDEKNPARGYDFEQFGIYYKILLDKDGNGTRTLATVAGPKEYQGEVVIPDEVRYGGHDYKVAMINGFQECAFITSITIPRYVRQIDEFYGDYYYATMTGPSIIKSPGKIIERTDTSVVTVLPHLKKINYNAIDCPIYGWRDQVVEWNIEISSPFPSSVQEIVIGEEVKKIPEYLFYQCKKVSSFTIPESVISIGQDVFRDDITLETVFFNAVDCRTVADRCFNYTNIIFGDNVKTFTRTFHPAYYSTTAKLTIPEGVECLAGIFDGNTILTDIILPKSMKTIGKNTFNECANLRNITFGAATKPVEGLLNLQEGIDSVCEHAFRRCVNIKEIHVPKTVRHLHSYAFGGTSPEKLVLNFHLPSDSVYDSDDGLQLNATVKYLEIGPDVTHLADKSFKSFCRSVKHLTFNAAHYIQDSYPYISCFDSFKNLETATIGDSATVVPHCFASNVDALKTLRVGKNVQSIGWYLGDRSNIDTLKWDSKMCLEGTAHGNICNLIMSDSVKYLPPICFAGLDFEKLRFSRSLEVIDHGAFNGCPYFTNLVLPDSLRLIGDFAFMSCPNLTEVTIPERVDTIYQAVFNDCPKLERVFFNATNCSHSVKWPDKNAHGIFSSKVREVTFGPGVSSIPGFLLWGCQEITELTIPESVRHIGCSAFGNSGLKRLTIPRNVETMDQYALANIDHLDFFEFNAKNAKEPGFNKGFTIDLLPLSVDTLVIGPDVESLRGIQRDRCNYYSTITEPYHLNELIYLAKNAEGFNAGGSHAVLDLPSVKIGNGVRTLPNGLFSKSILSAPLSIPPSVKFIDSGAFTDLQGLETLDLSENIDSIGAALRNTSITSIISRNPIPPKAFYPMEDEDYEKCVLYVPAKSLSLYQDHWIWRRFSRIEPISESVAASSGSPIYLIGDFNGWDMNYCRVAYQWGMQPIQHDRINDVISFSDNNGVEIRKGEHFKIATPYWQQQITPATQASVSPKANGIFDVTYGYGMGDFVAGEDISGQNMIINTFLSKMALIDRNAVPIPVSAETFEPLDVETHRVGDYVTFDSESDAFNTPWLLKIGDMRVGCGTYFGKGREMYGRWARYASEVNPFPAIEYGSVIVDLRTLTVQPTGFLNVNGELTSEFVESLTMTQNVFEINNGEKFITASNSYTLTSEDNCLFTTSEPISIHNGDEFFIIDNEGGKYVRLGVNGTTFISGDQEVQLVRGANDHITAEFSAESVYPELRLTEKTLSFKTSTSAKLIRTQNLEDESVAYYSLQGIKIAHPEKGSPYIRIVGGKSEKIIF